MPNPPVNQVFHGAEILTENLITINHTTELSESSTDEATDVP
jgi:hypothetical protein